MVVPFPAGGSVDVWRGSSPDRLGAVLGQSVVIENHGGGAGGRSPRSWSRRRPRRLHLLFTPGGALRGPGRVHEYRLRSGQSVCAGRAACRDAADHFRAPGLPVRTLPELVAYAKANPGKMWGSQGFGTSPHLFAEMFKLAAGIDILHVPYRGTARCSRP